MKFSQKIIYSILAFLSGILISESVLNMILGEGVFLGTWVWWMSAVCVGMYMLIGNWKKDVMRPGGYEYSIIWWVRLLLLCIAGIFYFHGSFLTADDVAGVKHYVGQEIRWTVRIDAEVDVRRSGQKLTVEVLDWGEGEGIGKLKGKVLLNVSKYPRYTYGDVLQISGFLEEPFETDDFSYKKYLERYSIYGIVKNPWIEMVRNEVNNPFYHGVFTLKVWVQQRINQLWAEPYASFESGLLLGARKGIPDYLTEAFNITGLTHIIAISGYNISLVIVLVGVAFSSMGRKRRVVMSVIFVIVFTVLVGMSAAVVRAAIMGSIGLVALYFGRSTQVTLTLLMSALLMNIVNPKILPYDVGFQLSFAATCGVVYVAPRIEKWFSWEVDIGGWRLCVPKKFEIREALQMTIAAQISTLPIILFHFGRLSIVSPLANVLVAPFIPLSMAVGAIAFMLSLVSSFLALIAAGVTWFFLEIIIQLTLLCAKVPYASIEVGGFDIVLVCVVYLLMWEWLRDKPCDNDKRKSTQNFG